MSDRSAALFRRAVPVVAIVLFVAALLLLRHQLQVHNFHDIVGHLKAIPARALRAAAGLTLLSYLLLTRYDDLGLRYVGRRMPAGRVALASFMSYAISHTVGWAVFSGGAVRYRYWSTWGLSAGEIAQATSFIAVMLWLGVLALGGLTLAADPALLVDASSLSPFLLRMLGAGCLALVAAYLALPLLRRTAIHLGRWELPIPTLSQAVLQLSVSILDWVLAAGVLFVLLPQGMSVGFPAFVGVFVVAQVAGLISHVPAGVGVFDAVILVVLGGRIGAAEALGVLVAYRAIYYLVPLLLALGLLVVTETAGHRAAIRRIAGLAGRWTPELAATGLSLLVFLGGIVLLVSGALPRVPSRLIWLDRFLPLFLIEAFHFLGSVIGAGLIVLAWSLRRRVDAAYYLTLAMLAGGIIASLGKGADYEEAIVLGSILLLLLPARPLFRRKASVLAEPFTAGWLVALLMVVIGVVVLGEFSYRDALFDADALWRFTLHGDATRFLRATLGVLSVFMLVGAIRLLRPMRPEPRLPDAAELERVDLICRRARESRAVLALLGDKAILWSASGEAFLMYATQGRSWIALGDPVGPPAEQEELVWAFRSMVHQHDGWPVFYEVGRDNLPLYVDLGLTLNKLGEEARVALGEFTMEGSSRSGLRNTRRRLQREGCTFRVVEPAGVPAILPRLREISDQWLAEKQVREKRFSLGWFDPGYLARGRVAVIEKAGEIIAFVSLWAAAPGTEMSGDLMRFGRAAPPGVMDLLFTEVLLWGQSQGYAWFSLGMAPLAGFEQHPLAPLWHRVGSLLYRHGERFYNFRGLRAYKDKFDPHWEPRYLASPGGLVLPRVLGNVATLISEGWRGLVGR